MPSNKPNFVKLNALKIFINIKASIKICIKCNNRITPEQFHDWYKFNHGIHEHSTRSNFNVNDGIIINNLFVPSANTNEYGSKQLKVKMVLGSGTNYPLTLKMLHP